MKEGSRRHILYFGYISACANALVRGWHSTAIKFLPSFFLFPSSLYLSAFAIRTIYGLIGKEKPYFWLDYTIIWIAICIVLQYSRSFIHRLHCVLYELLKTNSLESRAYDILFARIGFGRRTLFESRDVILDQNPPSWLCYHCRGKEGFMKIPIWHYSSQDSSLD